MSNRVPDGNGWFEIPANPLSRVGVFDYLGKSIGHPDAGRMFKVLRPIEELGSEETINSFRLVPFIIDHTMLGKATPDAIPAEQKGVHGVIGDKVWFDIDQGVLFGNLKVFSQTLELNLDAGKIELSLGYKAQYDFTPGIWNGVPYDVVQRNIRGNHVALVPDGRMGSDIAVLDSVPESFVVTFDAKELKMPLNTKWIDLMAKRMQSGVAVATFDAEEAEAGSPTLEDVAALLKQVLPTLGKINEAVAAAGGAGAAPAAPVDDKVTAAADDIMDDGADDDMEDVMDAAGKPVMDADGKPMKQKKGAPAVPTAAMDAADIKRLGKIVAVRRRNNARIVATMDAAILKAVTAATTPLNAKIADMQAGGTKAVMLEVAKRNDMVNRLKPFVGVFDASEMTLPEVATYAVKKLEIPGVSAGNETIAVEAWLHGRQPSTPAFAGATFDRREVPEAAGSVAEYLKPKA